MLFKYGAVALARSRIAREKVCVARVSSRNATRTVPERIFTGKKTPGIFTGNAW